MLYGNAVRAPAPTAGPSRQAVNRRLGLRQDALTEICGWGTSLPGLNGGAATNVLPLVCTDGWTCAHNSILSVEGCCPGSIPLSDCTLVTTCWDRTMWLASQSEFNSGPGGTMACTDEARQYCAELSYNNGYSTFACGPSTGIIENAYLGSSLPAMFTTPVTTPTGPSPTTPSPGPTSTSPAPAPSSGGSAISTGAIVAIAIAGAVVILGALIVYYLVRRSNAKKADARAREAESQRHTFMEQRSSQMPPVNPITASWVNSQKPPEPSVTEFSHGYSHHSGPMYNDDDFEGTVNGTVAGTVDHNAGPRF